MGVFLHPIFKQAMIDTDLYQAKKLYPFQEKTVYAILEELEQNGKNFNLLYQLPTGGGKTVIFSEIAKKFIENRKEKVLILTHRIELSIQTSKQLNAIGVENKIINSDVKTIPDQNEFHCFIAMVETLNNRLNENGNFIEEYIALINRAVNESIQNTDYFITNYLTK